MFQFSIRSVLSIYLSQNDGRTIKLKNEMDSGNLKTPMCDKTFENYPYILCT